MSCVLGNLLGKRLAEQCLQGVRVQRMEALVVTSSRYELEEQGLLLTKKYEDATGVIR